MNLGSLCRIFLHCLIPSAVGVGCSVLYEPGGQCKKDSDCVRLARQVAELSGSFCQNDVCVLPEPVSHDCETNADCVSQASGDPAICREYRCIPLLHEECRQILNAEALSTSNDVVLLGAFAQLNDLLPAQDTVLMSYQLALDEVMSYTKGAVGYSDFHDRPFVIVGCQSNEAQKLSDSFDHLAKTLKVPIVITNQQSSVLEDQVTRLLGEGTNSMFLSPLSSDPALAALKDKGRLWHLLGSATDLSPAYHRLIDLQAARVSGTQLRVLTVVNDFRAMNQIADLIEVDLKINGLSVTDANAAGTYRRVSVESEMTNPNNPDTGKILPAILEIKPNVIVLLAGPEVIEPAILTAENSWQVFGLEEAPQYVLSHHLFNSPKLSEALSSHTGTETRIYGINYAGAKDRTLYQRYLSQLSAHYPDAYIPEFENYYDAANFAMLSIIAVAKDRATTDINGDLAVKGFRRLIDDNGVHYDLKPENLSNIATGILEADSEATVYLTATLGEPKFKADGSRFADAALWCMNRDGRTLSFASGAVRFDTSTNEFEQDLIGCNEAGK